MKAVMEDDKEAKNFLAMINNIRKYQDVEKFLERAQAGALKSLVGPYNFYLTSSRSLQFLTSKVYDENDNVGTAHSRLSCDILFYVFNFPCNKFKENFSYERLVFSSVGVFISIQGQIL